MPLLFPGLFAFLFAGLLVLVVTGWGPLDAFDLTISEALRGYGSSRPALIGAVRIGTDVMATGPFLALGGVAALVLALRRDWRAFRFVVLVTALMPILWSLMHVIIPHERPADGFVTVHSYGFPSGHTTNAATFGVALALLLWPRVGAAGRTLVVISAVFFAVSIAVTRLVLLAHWPSDVLGGWLLALAVVPPLARLADRRNDHELPDQGHNASDVHRSV